MSWYRAAGKRVVDVVGAAILLLVTLPVQGVVAGAVWVVLGRPVLFVQDRPGRDGKVFRLCKFRSMRSERYAGEPDGDRLTNFGHLLRSTSLDELPTLWNVLRGDMSLVGPRPLLVAYLERYTPEQARRHEVRPGVTGLAQARGRNGLSWQQKLALDVEYVDRCSFRLDVRLLLETVGAVLRRSGISADGHTTMAEFRGSHDGSVA